MKRNLGLAALVLALAAVFAWLARDSGEAAGAAVDGRATSSASEVPHATESVDAIAGEADEVARSAVDAAAAAPVSAPAVAKVEPAPALDPSNAVQVRVIDHTTQKPVAGARVARLTDAMERTTFDMGYVMRLRDFDERVERDGSAVLTDSKGVALFAITRTNAVIVARSGDKLGLANATVGNNKVDVELSTDGEIRARVVDSTGRAAQGVPVALRRRIIGVFNDYAVDDTGADGIAVLRHALPPMFARQKPANLWKVALRGVFDPPIDVDVDPTKLSDPAAQLVMPLHGECEVTVLDERGAPCTELLSIGLRVLRTDQEPTMGQFCRDGALQYDDVTGGVQLFPFVQLGTPLEAFVRRGSGDVLHRAFGAAIARPGERGHITVKLAETACIVTGRVLDENGAPFVSSGVRARSQLSGPSDAREADRSLELDAEGKFRFELALKSESGVTRKFVVYTCDDHRADLLAAEHELPAQLLAGPLDVGDLLLLPAPFVAGGVVLDAHGAPLAAAEVNASTDRGLMGWWPREELRAVSDAAGHFEIRGTCSAPELRLTSGFDGAECDPVVTPPGRGDLVLQLRASGALAGRVLLEPRFAKIKPYLEIRFAGDDSPDASVTRRAELDSAGNFDVHGLPVGTCAVRVLIALQSGVAARVPNVAIEADRTTRDPRLDPLDLRGQLFSVTLRIVDVHDDPVTGAWVVLSSPDGESNRSDDSSLGKLVKFGFVCGPAGCDVRAGAPGMREVRLDAVKTDTTIVLTRGPAVRLELAQANPVAPPNQLAVLLVPEDYPTSSGADYGSPAGFDDQGVARLASSVVGRARVVLFLIERTTGGPRSISLPARSPQIVEVRDQADEQTISVLLDPADLEAARERRNAR